MKLSKITIGIGILAFALACTTNPVTGRKSFQLMGDSEISAMSLQQYNEVLSKSKVITNSKDATMVKSVGQRIQMAAQDYYKSLGREKDIANYKWEFNLIDDPQKNAWCMPGGKVAFYTGIMPICKDDTGVAVVMGHEVSHALAGHGNERISSQMLTQGLGMAGGMLIKNQKIQQVFSIAYPLGSQGALLAYGRKQELEADQMGLYIMAMAGYDPNQAPLFWHRMEAKETGSRAPEFLSTHPNPDNRRMDLIAHMDKAVAFYKASKYKK